MAKTRRYFLKSLVCFFVPFFYSRLAGAISFVGDNNALIKAIDDVLSGISEEVDGYYEITNPLTLTNKKGIIKFSQNFELKLLNIEKSGIKFNKCSELSIIGGNFSYKERPKKRIGHGGVLQFNNCSKILVRDGIYYQSPGTGIIFTLCDNPSVLNVAIWDTWADGLHFANCNNAIALDFQATNTGDDGLAFVNYGNHPDAKGGYANNVIINGSDARGIAIIGQSGVVVDKFEVYNTSSSGVKVAYESYYKTRVPSNIILKNGIIENAGLWCESKANGHGIFIERAEGEIRAENVKIVNSRIHGIGVAQYNGDLNLNSINIDGAGGSGITIAADNANLKNIQINNVNTSAIYFTGINKAILSGITVGSYGVNNNGSPLIWAVAANSLSIDSIQFIDEKKSSVRIGGGKVSNYNLGTISTLSSQTKVIQQWN